MRARAFYVSIARSCKVVDDEGVNMPRRKYGRMVKAVPPVPEEKCRYCRLGMTCPVHKKRL